MRAAFWLCTPRHSTVTSAKQEQRHQKRLLMMLDADVSLASMNIDVEDSLFHRRTEGGKMAAL